MSEKTRSLIIGGAGFLGSQLADHLIQLGHQVMILDNFSLKRNYIASQITIRHIRNFDIADRSVIELAAILNNFKPHYVYNYAAQPYIPDCYAKPLRAFEVNTLGALKVFEAAKQCNSIIKILQVSSAEVYGTAMDDKKKVALSETDSLSAPSTYAASKVAVDQAALNCYRESRLPVVVLRQFNCVGPRESHPYIVPEIIQQLHSVRNNKERIIKLGNNTSRDFMFSGDAVKFAELLITHGHPGEAYNLGYELSYKIYNIAQRIAKIMFPGEDYELVIQEDPTRVRYKEIWNLRSDNCKILTLLRNEEIPDTPLNIGLKVAYEDFKSNNFTWGF